MANNPIVTGNYFDKYGSRNPIVQRIMNSFLRNYFEALHSIPIPNNILEVGCADGKLAARTLDQFMRSIFLVGIDLGYEELKKGKYQRSKIKFVNGSISNLPFSDQQFDLVIAPEVLEHLTDPQQGLEEICRVACKFMILSVPWEPIWRLSNFLSGRYMMKLGNTPGHIQHWTRREFIRFISPHLKIIKVLTPFPWTMVLAERRR